MPLQSLIISDNGHLVGHYPLGNTHPASALNTWEENMTNKKPNDLHYSHIASVAPFTESGAGECVGETSVCVCVCVCSYLCLLPYLLGCSVTHSRGGAGFVPGASLCSGKLQGVSLCRFILSSKPGQRARVRQRPISSKPPTQTRPGGS